MNSFSTRIAAWRRSLLAAAGCAAMALGAPAAQAATPSSGTVSPGNSPTWQGDSGRIPTRSATCDGPNDPTCDNYRLTIDPGSFTDYKVTIRLQPIGADDWDVQVYAPNGGVVGSSGNAPGFEEVVVLTNSPAPGVYTVAAAPYAGPVGYNASATIESTDPVISKPGNEQVEFYSYEDPRRHSFGEPNGGINWQSEPADGMLGGDNGGTIMYISGLDTLRIRLNDCTAPATYLQGGDWVERNVPSHVETLDPILFTDHLSGRTLSSQLLGKTSAMMWSDDDGESWNPSQGSGINSGVDHQTVGGGPLAEPLASEENVGYNGYKHGVYYCSQDVAIAQCGLSLDGGTTFGVSVPMYNATQCGGLHGHVEVSKVDGTAYVPNPSCGGEQGIAITEDNNETWRVRTVPNSGSSSSDPSVAEASGGRLYFGYDNGGKAFAAVSDNKGDSWYNIRDVGAPFNIQSTAFPEMIAGDNDRAAFAFLGSTTLGAIGDDPTFDAVWHLYVAMTFDGGDTWTTVKVDPNDPVQRGTICGGGFGGCDNGTRNLLDFNDIQIDKRGRPVVIYADGCVDECVTNPSVNTLDNVSMIARLKSPKGLFAAYDNERMGQPDWPLATATHDGTNVTLTWQEPGDGGNTITGYTVTGPGLNVSLDANARSYTHENSADVNGAYQVFAHNAAGSSRTKPMCDYNVTAVEGEPPPPPEDPCDTLGVTVLTDKSGDSDFNLEDIIGFPNLTNGPASLDVTRLGISESQELGAGKIAFLLHVQDTSVLLPDSYWPILFENSAGVNKWVRMRTLADGSPVFEYGTGSGSTGEGVTGAADGLADPASGFIGSDVIRIIVNRSDIGAEVGTEMDPKSLTRFLVRVRAPGSVLTPDNMPDNLARVGSYSPIGSENCVDDENILPIARDDSATTQVDTPVVIDALANDEDPDGPHDGLNITGTSHATHGNVIVFSDADGDKIRYEPDQGYVGPDSFTYTIRDEKGGTAQATVSITVQADPGNQPPVANDDKAKTPQGTPVTIAVLSNDSDPDDNHEDLYISSLTQPSNGAAANHPDQTITYTPNAGFIGTDSFTYTVSDGRGGSDTATVTVKVQARDDDDFDDDGDSDDIDSDDDNDGKPDDADSDDDNDGIPDDVDSDDDNDGIEDDFDDQSTDDEVQGQSARTSGNSSSTFNANVDPNTLVLIADVRGAGASMLSIDIIDSSGVVIGTSVPTLDGARAIVAPLLIGDFTIRVNNPTSQDVDYELTIVRQQFR